MSKRILVTEEDNRKILPDLLTSEVGIVMPISLAVLPLATASPWNLRVPSCQKQLTVLP